MLGVEAADSAWGRALAALPIARLVCEAGDLWRTKRCRWLLNPRKPSALTVQRLGQAHLVNAGSMLLIA